MKFTLTLEVEVERVEMAAAWTGNVPAQVYADYRTMGKSDETGRRRRDRQSHRKGPD